ncbi:MAG TPA: hypothetical protein EYO62_05645 [Aquificales bacterium]|nr:hypothetical protein [Aquificales bacterium]
MRLIDKLPMVHPPEDRYTLIPASKGFKPFLLGGRTKQVFPFAVDNLFYRGIAFNKKYKPIVKPFEKVYPEETSIDVVLEDLKEEIENIKESLEIPLNKFKFGTYIPTRYGFLKIYSLAKNVSKAELIRTIELYIEEDINENFPGKEVVYAYDFLKTEKDEPYRVLITIVESEIIQKLETWAENIGIRLDIISYEPICLINLGLLKGLPIPFTILYTDVNKILVLAYQKDRILYEEFSYVFSPDKMAEDVLNLIIWDIRNYIVLNDLSNIYLAGVVTEYEHLMEYFLEKLPIFGIVSIDVFPERYSLLYTLGERLLNV